MKIDIPGKFGYVFFYLIDRKAVTRWSKKPSFMVKKVMGKWQKFGEKVDEKMTM